VVGPNNESDAGLEASLDVQTIIALGSNVSTEFWSTAGTNPDNDLDEPFLAWLQAVAAQDDAALPHVITISYGDDEWSLSPEYARRVSAEFASLGARGVSILAASGDSGVGGDGTDDNCTRVLPTFPASSPWVTAVGGASFPHDEVTDEAYTLQDEVAWASSGGGFSDLFPVPAYQNDSVHSYLKDALLPPADLYNSTGASRGYPDVSTQSLKFVVTANGLGYSGVSGTSAAAPTFAGIVSLLSSRRLAAGKEPRLGFLNPLLYANPDGLNDIIIGSNPACGAMGFQSRDDWDPVTGLGTPIFAALSDIVDALP
jgi:tripeptidyl-peptidase-1